MSAAYYVTAIDAGRYFLMSGPYQTHDAALADVDRCMQVASDHDGRAWFMAWGTSKIENETRPGRMQRAGLVGSIT